MDDAGTRELVSVADVGSAAQFHEAMEIRGLGIAQLDTLGRIIWATPLFCKRMGHSDAELRGMDVRRIWPKSRRVSFDRVWALAQDKGQFAWRAADAEGTDRSWRLVRRGASTSYLWIEPESASAADSLEVERLRELNEMRIHFINTAAHEFATPLTPLRLQTNLLLNEKLGPITERQRRSLDILDRNMERLGQLVRDVLDVSRIEAGRFAVQFDTVNLGELARQTVESFMDTAQQAGVTLVYEGPDALGVEGDKDRLTQVFVNLVSNALKFTPKGGKISCTLTTNEGTALVVVEDTGRGIAPDKIGKLFQPFSQVHDTSQETKSGTGLGLSICQGIIAQHGGRIWAESQGLGGGARFSFLLPLHPDTPLAAADVGAGPHKIVRVEPGGRWNLFFFKCPECGSRDIEIRLLKNRYDCNGCQATWK